ncbi:MAG: TrmH family RNA methyltransferase [Candidatus Saccharibacteria bacterium]|nr:TrmH family RNA methyltransferase [Candidatus Saccharibacteria bacterium]
MRLFLVLHNIRSCYNVGAILRTAEGFGIEKVVLSGYTPRVHDEALLPHLREKLDREIHKTALGAEDMVDLVNLPREGNETTRRAVCTEDGSKTGVAENLKALLLDYKEQGFKILGLENNIKKDLVALNNPKLKEIIGDKCVLLLGEEVAGIDPELYDLIDIFVEIPMKGQKESFNVSVAAGIAMYGLINA